MNYLLSEYARLLGYCKNPHCNSKWRRELSNPKWRRELSNIRLRIYNDYEINPSRYENLSDRENYLLGHII